jgi:hypothetical protein
MTHVRALNKALDDVHAANAALNAVRDGVRTHADMERLDGAMELCETLIARVAAMTGRPALPSRGLPQELRRHAARFRAEAYRRAWYNMYYGGRECPKAVFAALAVAYASRGGDYLNEASAEDWAREWWARASNSSEVRETDAT